ncbi:DUF3995 domain-containing protein [Kitasatospora sp. NBC_01539]|uniref:DUF3995 domain-containing protein n=1 Tax=Kitasatospora sp. NBC_01539 TaxID=2903577 RepID=UPI00386020FF
MSDRTSHSTTRLEAPAAAGSSTRATPLASRSARRRTVAVALAGVLGVDAGWHLYWATGTTWPARDAYSLSMAVLNAKVPFTPIVVLPLAAALAGTALLLLARGGVVRLPLPPTVPRLATAVVAAGTAIRAATGLIWATGAGTVDGSAFRLLNLLLYTPLCAACAGAAWWLVKE